MNKALRVAVGILLTLVVLLGIVLTAFYIGIDSYLKGDNFRILVSGATSQSLHLEGEYLPFHWAGFSVHSDGYYGKGRPGQPISNIRADQIRADLNFRPILEGVWSVPKIDVQSLTIELHNPGESPVPPLETAVTETAPAHPGFFARLLPNRVDIGEINIRSVNLAFKPGPPVTIRDLQAQLTPEGNTWAIHAHEGTLRHPDWPAFTIQNAKLRASADQIYFTEIDLQLADHGRIELSGDIDNRGTAPVQLQALVKNAPITAFLTGDWRARLTGDLAGQVKWTGDLHGPAPIRADGSLRLVEGRIEALPFLDKIASLTKTEEFRSLKLHKANADFIWIADRKQLEVNNLILESDGIVRVQGKFTVTDDQIDGTFVLGTAPSVIKFLPGAETQVFTDKHDGYVWTPFTLKGPVNSPKEDLTPRLQAAALHSIGETANQGLQQVIDAAKSLLPF